MLELDRSIFLYLNSLHTPFLDEVMWGVSLRTIWIPLYLFIIYLLIREYGRRVWIVLVLAIVLILITDQVSSLIKDTVERLRPCRDPSLEGLVHIVHGKCGGGRFGFISSHASNMFGIAAFTAPLIMKRWYTWFIFIWAAVISYSRIYLGVHYPGDVVGGILLGLIAGFGLELLFKKLNKRPA